MTDDIIGKTFRELYGEPVEDTSDEPFTYHGEELTDEVAERITAETLRSVPTSCPHLPTNHRESR